MFSFDVKPYRTKAGGVTNLILVTGDATDSTMEYKEEMKQFGARWIGALRTWGWWGSSDPEKNKTIIEKMVKPAIEFLLSKEKNPGSDESRNLVSILDKILQALNTENTDAEEMANTNVYMTKAQISDKIYSFKAKLVSTVSSDEFKRLIMPIMKARKAQGYRYSFSNIILIWCQDPEATMVKNKTDWLKANRRIKPNAPAIGLFIKTGGSKRFKGREERARAKQEWLRDNGFQSEAELSVGDKERLRHYLDSTDDSSMSFKLGFYFYDVRYTEQIEGTEDVVGDGKAQVPWFNDTGNETMAVKEKIECVLEVIKDSGVNVSSTANLGGALGVSKSGSIEVLDKAKLNSNFLMTITHEFAHELLHQKYLHDNNPEFGKFYFGRPEGKGFVEQQAELTAWIVCNFYGYDIQEAINYAAIWGMDEKNAVHAFDTVAKVADFIINKTNEKIKIRRETMVDESKQYLNEVNFTGRDVAAMLGKDALALYDRGVQQQQQEEAGMQEAIKNFKDMVNKINECDKNRTQEVID